MAAVTMTRIAGVGQCEPELRRREHRVAVGAEPEEGHVPEVEQPREPDDDVQPEREQHVDQRVEADPEHVAVVREERHAGGGDRERDVVPDHRDAFDLAADSRR